MRLSAFYLIATAFLACGIHQSLAQDDSQIANTTEPLGGQPAAGAKPSVPDLNYQVAYQRAFEAVIWLAFIVMIGSKQDQLALHSVFNLEPEL